MFASDDMVDARRFQVNAQSIEFGPWHISFNVSCILPSVCSTKVVCERDDDQFCQFCIYCKELEVPHFPDMVFPNNILILQHKNGAKISFNPLEALKKVACTVRAIEVACADEWLESRPEAEKKKTNFDWTFSTDYKGTLSEDITIEPTDERIDFELLKKKDQIIFYHDLTLFEDELHDHGISKLSVKILQSTFSQRPRTQYIYKLYKPPARLTTTLNNSYMMCIKIFNKLPDYFKDEPFNKFKRLTKAWLLKRSFYSRVMPSYWYVLMRYFLRVDSVLVRSHETRFFHKVENNYIIREYTSKEAKAKDITIPTLMANPDEVIALLPVKQQILEKLTINV